MMIESDETVERQVRIATIETVWHLLEKRHIDSAELLKVCQALLDEARAPMVRAAYNCPIVRLEALMAVQRNCPDSQQHECANLYLDLSAGEKPGCSHVENLLNAWSGKL